MRVTITKVSWDEFSDEDLAGLLPFVFTRVAGGPFDWLYAVTGEVRPEQIWDLQVTVIGHFNQEIVVGLDEGGVEIEIYDDYRE